MEKFIVMGGNRLNGEIAVQAAKNAVLPLMSCCILSKEEIVLKNCPLISDVMMMAQIIRQMGGKVAFVGNDIHINCTEADSRYINAELTKSMRSSVFMLGPMLGRFKKAKLSYPGGCEIGKRPIDIHIAGLESIGVRTKETELYIECDGEDIHGGEVALSFPSVGATENMIMAAVLVKGTTVIGNAAKEPEIVDLQRFINMLGGNVSGAGTSRITVNGVDKLHGGVFEPIGDRIAAGTYLTMCACCGGDVTVRNVDPNDLRAVLTILKECGSFVEETVNSVRIVSTGQVKAVPFLRTGPFPAFPTDMQPQLCALLSTANGVSYVEETVFENRFKYTRQLESMGADITVEGRKALITGVNELRSGVLFAEDLRGGAALITAAMKADGVSSVYGVEYIDRGYYKIEETLTKLGADIVRVSK